MLHRSSRLCCALVILALLPSRMAFAEPTGQDDLENLIDSLLEITEPGYGYSTYFAGSEFLPYEGTGEWSTGVIGAIRATRSDALKKLVEQGADAIPVLLKHIDDKRPLKMDPISGMMRMEYSTEYDFNGRTRANPPEGVNRELFSDDDEEAKGDGEGPENNDEPEDLEPNEHRLRVGDVCFVALGQIVNRYFSASR